MMNTFDTGVLEPGCDTVSIVIPERENLDDALKQIIERELDCTLPRGPVAKRVQEIFDYRNLMLRKWANQEPEQLALPPEQEAQVPEPIILQFTSSDPSEPRMPPAPAHTMIATA